MNQFDSINSGDLLVPGSLDMLAYEQDPLSLINLYTKADLHRIGTIKMGADQVYDYFRDLLDDHRILMDTKAHAKRVETLVETLIGLFGVTPDQSELMKYFTANVLQSSQLNETATTGSKTWLPFKDETIANLFIKDEVKEILAGKSIQEMAMFAGVFVSDKTETHPYIEFIREAMVVGSDLLFIQTHKYNLLIAAASQQLQDDAEDDLLGTLGGIVASSPVDLFGDDFKPL